MGRSLSTYINMRKPRGHGIVEGTCFPGSFAEPQNARGGDHHDIRAGLPLDQSDNLARMLCPNRGAIGEINNAALMIYKNKPLPVQTGRKPARVGDCHGLRLDHHRVTCMIIRVIALPERGTRSIGNRGVNHRHIICVAYDFRLRNALRFRPHDFILLVSRLACSNGDGMTRTLTHLERLEAEAIHVMREVVAGAERPVMLYSIGKDSAVMLHLARKAFYPASPPFPLLHVDTTWKFKAMYDLREKSARDAGMELLIWQNPEAKERGINPFDHGPLHTDMWKTQGLKQALDHHGFDAAFGGARRDEEKSRAKERIFSFRAASHGWDPKNQRPELWNLYNARKNKGESIRVFPISNWTELDIWQYIQLNNIEIVPLYFSAKRPTYEWAGGLFMADDMERLERVIGRRPMITERSIRFRTLGCFPLTGAVESTASNLSEVIQEMLLTKTSERQGRVIDKDAGDASMEKKKQEGYF